MASAKYFVQPEFKNKRRFLEPKIVMMKKYREIDDFKVKFTEICSSLHSVWKLRKFTLNHHSFFDKNFVKVTFTIEIT